MIWALIKDSLPLKVCTLLLLGLLLWWLGWFGSGLLVIVLAVDILLFKQQYQNATDLTDSKDILALFSIDDTGQLRFGMERAVPNYQAKAQLRQDHKHAYLKLEINSNGPLHYRFPIAQLQPLQTWLETHAPQVQLGHDV
ncbi:MAG: hypothetical protein LAT66_07335 [Alkalimonas sp.]|nr:hypothetical protein [Alkalimonas sp.]